MIQVVVRDDGWEDHLHPTLIEHVVNLAHEHKLSVSRVIEAAIVTYLNRAHAANITDRSRAAAQWLERGDDLLLLERGASLLDVVEVLHQRHAERTGGTP